MIIIARVHVSLLVFCYFIYHFGVAIALLEQVLLWPCGCLGRLCLHPPAHTQALFKGCCRKLAYGSFQWTHVTWWPCCSRWVNNSSQMEDKTYYSTHNFATGWTSAPKCQFTMVITTESSWAFPENCTTNGSWIRCPSDGGPQEDKSATTKVSFHTTVIHLSPCMRATTTV